MINYPNTAHQQFQQTFNNVGSLRFQQSQNNEQLVQELKNDINQILQGDFNKDQSFFSSIQTKERNLYQNLLQNNNSKAHNNGQLLQDVQNDINRYKALQKMNKPVEELQQMKKKIQTSLNHYLTYLNTIQSGNLGVVSTTQEHVVNKTNSRPQAKVITEEEFKRIQQEKLKQGQTTPIKLPSNNKLPSQTNIPSQSKLPIKQEFKVTSQTNIPPSQIISSLPTGKTQIRSTRQITKEEFERIQRENAQNVKIQYDPYNEQKTNIYTIRNDTGERISNQRVQKLVSVKRQDQYPVTTIKNQDQQQSPYQSQKQEEVVQNRKQSNWVNYNTYQPNNTYQTQTQQPIKKQEIVYQSPIKQTNYTQMNGNVITQNTPVYTHQQPQVIKQEYIPQQIPMTQYQNNVRVNDPYQYQNKNVIYQQEVQKPLQNQPQLQAQNYQQYQQQPQQNYQNQGVNQGGNEEIDYENLLQTDPNFVIEEFEEFKQHLSREQQEELEEQLKSMDEEEQFNYKQFILYQNFTGEGDDQEN